MIDNQYPSLSSLAQQYGKIDLAILGQKAQPKGNVLFGLGDCCNEVLKGVPRVSAPRCDSYNYLATIDAFVKTIGNDCRRQKKLWNKIKQSETFLNTVVEAAWAVHFCNSGLSPLTDEPLDPSNPERKDADVVVVLDGIRYWLDALNVDLCQSPFFIAPNNMKPSRPSCARGSLVDELVKRAREKYKDKFGEAISSGRLHGCVGVLLCVMKSESYVMPHLRLVESLPPPRLFGADTQGLSVVVIHMLRDDQNSDVLRPCKLLNWVREAGQCPPIL